MKRTRKLLSLFLSAALVGQMGAVVGWGDVACGANNDHGKTQRVSAACGEVCAHWLESDNTQTVQGGSGDNYYHVKPNDTIVCGSGINHIVVNLNDFTVQNGKFAISSYNSSRDMIYFIGAKQVDLQGPTIDGNNNSPSLLYTVVAGSKTIEISSDAEIQSPPIPIEKVTKPGIKIDPNNEREISVKTLSSGGIGAITYSWQKWENNKWTDIPGKEGTSYTAEIPANAAVGSRFRYRCVAADNARSTAESDPVEITVPGCENDVMLGDISCVVEDSYFPQSDLTVSLPASMVVTAKANTAGGCTIHGGDPYHGYTIVWSVSANNYGVAVSGNTLIIPAAALPTDENDGRFILTATLLKDGQEAGRREVEFKAQKYLPPCDAVASLTTITSPTQLIQGKDPSISCESNFAVTGGTACTEHAGDPNHGYKLQWTFTPENSQPIPGVTFRSDAAVFEIDKKLLSTDNKTGILAASVVRDGNGTKAGLPEAQVTINFQAEKVVCTATPKSIALDKPETVWDTADGSKQSTPFTAQCKWNNCTHDGGSHDAAPTWLLVENPSWLKIEANGLITITGDIPQTSNTMTVRAVIGEGSNQKMADAKLTITRPPRCNAKVTDIIIRGDEIIHVVQGREVIKNYIAERKYEGGCEFGDAHKEGHGETVTWRYTLDTNTAHAGEDAFAIDSGNLVIRGNKLQERNNYTVTIYAKAGDIEKKAGLDIRCAAPNDDDDDDDDSYIWESYEDKIEDAKRGSTVKMNLTGNAEVPFYIFDSARGRDVNLQMKVGNNYTWTVNGKTLKRLPAGQIFIPMDVETYKDKTLTRLCRDYDVRTFKVRHIGSFYGDMKLTVDVGVGNAKKTMYLYSYDEDKERLTYQGNALADNNGDATFVMTRSLGAYAVTSKALYGEKPVSGGGGLVGSGNGPVTVYPPVASVTTPPASSSSLPASSGSSSGSFSSESSSESSEPAPPPAPPSSSSQEPAAPVENETQPKEGIPVLVPLLILAIAGVITATVLVVRSGRGKLDDFDAD